MIRIKYMWSYYEGSVLVEGICECEAAPAFIAQLFNDPHLTFIQANGVLYGRGFGPGWSNNYLGTIEESNDWVDAQLYW